MAETLVPSESIWSTVQMMPEQGEILAAAWASALAQDAGWVYAAAPWEWLGNLSLSGTDNGTATSYITAGTYAVYAHLVSTSAGTHTAYIDGTQIVTHSGAGAYAGTLTPWVIADDGWYAVTATCEGVARVDFSAFREHKT